MKERGWTAYRLAKESRLPQPTIYRLLETKDRESKIALGTIDALCEALDVEPGELLEREPKKRGGKR
jgi:DNA-binding Xre family transcriptional regulator